MHDGRAWMIDVASTATNGQAYAGVLCPRSSSPSLSSLPPHAVISLQHSLTSLALEPHNLLIPKRVAPLCVTPLAAKVEHRVLVLHEIWVARTDNEDAVVHLHKR
eukprot:scaffold218233_cov41-Tisochrysis_lutea.AAC.1